MHTYVPNLIKVTKKYISVGGGHSCSTVEKNYDFIPIPVLVQEAAEIVSQIRYGH